VAVPSLIEGLVKIDQTPRDGCRYTEDLLAVVRILQPAGSQTFAHLAMSQLAQTSSLHAVRLPEQALHVLHEACEIRILEEDSC